MHPAPVLAAALVALAACRGGPRPLRAGEDACEYCRMTISDVRFGGEVRTRTGRLRVFDSPECLASYVLAAGDQTGVWVADFTTSRLVPVDRARFLHGGRVGSPMGRSLVAFAAGQDEDALRARYGGEVLSWSQVLDLLRAERLEPGAVPPGATGRTAAGEPRR